LEKHDASFEMGVGGLQPFYGGRIHHTAGQAARAEEERP